MKSKITSPNNKSCLPAIAIDKFAIHNKEVCMKSLLAAITFIALVLTQTRAFADLPEPKAGPQNPNMEAGRKAIDAKDRKSTRLNSSHLVISYAVFCLKKKNKY